MKGSVWLSMAGLWVAYAAVFTGYCWLRGYNIGFGEIVDPLNFYQGAWPPGAIPDGVVWPGQQPPGATGTTGGAIQDTSSIVAASGATINGTRVGLSSQRQAPNA